MFKKIASAAVLAGALVVAPAVSASADPISPNPNHIPRTWKPKTGGPISPNPSHVPRTWQPRTSVALTSNNDWRGMPPTCDYERWTGDWCSSTWTVSIKEECEQIKVYNYTLWKSDRVCQRYVIKAHKVHKGDTLWNISKRYYGNGKYWRTIAKANKIKGTTIKVGQVLTIPVR